jgi:hypothetical protein
LELKKYVIAGPPDDASAQFADLRLDDVDPEEA